jgi:hypothetical protein
MKKQTTVIKTLFSQSTKYFTLFKIRDMYFVQCNLSKVIKYVGDKDKAEDLILYGIDKDFDFKNPAYKKISKKTIVELKKDNSTFVL